LAYEQTPLSNDTIDSILRHQEVGRAKDLSASPRTNYVYTACSFVYTQCKMKVHL